MWCSFSASTEALAPRCFHYTSELPIIIYCSYTRYLSIAIVIRMIECVLYTPLCYLLLPLTPAPRDQTPYDYVFGCTYVCTMAFASYIIIRTCMYMNMYNQQVLTFYLNLLCFL